MDSFYITKLAEYFPTIYVGLTFYQGKLHAYMGMDFGSINKVIVKFPTVKYLNNVIKYLPERLVPIESMPDTNHLSNMRDESEAQYLPEEQAQTFHRTF